MPTNTPSLTPNPAAIPMLDPRGLAAVAAIFAAIGILRLKMFVK
jgi:hypothetical protein